MNDEDGYSHEYVKTLQDQLKAIQDIVSEAAWAETSIKVQRILTPTPRDPS